MKVKHLFLSMIAAAFLTSAIDADKSLTIGKKAPEIETVEGSNVVADAKAENKNLVVNFWTPKSPASRIANKTLNQKYGQGNQDTEFISICTDPDEELMEEVMWQDGVDGTRNIAYSKIDSRVFKDYNVEKSPRTYYIGSDGKISKM